MKRVNADEIRRFVVAQLVDPILAKGLDPETLPDNFDFLTEGIIDSLGFVELIVALEKYFDIRVNLTELDPQHLTILGPFCRHIEQTSTTADLREL